MTNLGTERVTYRTERGGRRTIYLQGVQVRRTKALGYLLTGVEVDREGDEVYGKGFDERHHVISLDVIVSRQPVVMDNIYGEFVDA